MNKENPMSIENHKFQDSDITSAGVENDMVYIYLRNDVATFEYLQLDRDDIIALVKAIELTGKDLK